MGEVAVGRSIDVAEVFWSRVLAEWGTNGPDAARQIHVPIERFLSQLDWLAPACRRHQVGIIWDEASRALVSNAHHEKASRLALAAGTPPLSEQDVTTRLRNGRFSRELKP